MMPSTSTPLSSPRRLRARAERRLRWLRRSAAAGTLTLAMLHGAPDAAAQVASDPAGSEFQVNTVTAQTQRNSSVAMDADGDFVVVWQSQNQDVFGGYGVYAQRYNAAGVAQGSEFLVNTVTSGDQRRPAVAMDADGDFVIAWQSNGQDGDGFGIYAQRYAADGTPQGTEFLVNTFTTNNQTNPSVAMDADGDFVIVWASSGQDDPSTSTTGVYAQRYNAAGVAQGSEFLVNTYTTNFQSTPSVAMDADGDFVIAWASYFQDGDGNGVYAQRYNVAGVAQGAEFQVNTFTSVNQNEPSVAMDADGDFVIAWESFGQDDTVIAYSNYYSGIFAQRYASDGTPQGSEFQVNTYTTNSQQSSSVAMDTGGNFIVTWASRRQDDPVSFGAGVFAQRYAADGTAQGSEFQVNTFTTGDQMNPAVAMDADGDFVVAWQSYNQDGYGDGVFAQRYATAAAVDLRVFDFDALTLALNNQPDATRVAAWPDAGPLMLDAVLGAKQPLFLASVASLAGQPAVFFDGNDDRLAIAKSDALFATPQPEKSLALAFRTGNDVTTRQVLVELGGQDAGLNVYLDGGNLVVGGWSQAGLASDWGPFFFDTPVAAQTAYVVTVAHRRDAAGQPGRFEAYVNGAQIGLARPAVNSFAAVNDNGGVGVVTGTTRFADGVSSSPTFGRLVLGRVVQENRWLSPGEREALEGALAGVYGITLTSADEAPVAASAAVPSGLEIDAYPNPTAGATTVRFGLDATSEVRVVVYDALGREVAVLAEGTREAGWHRAVLSSAELASGVYVVRVEAGAEIVTRRVTVLR